MDHVTGKSSHGEVSKFQTIATCRDGLKNSCEKSATSPRLRRGNWEIGDVRDKTRGSQRRRGQINRDVMALSWTCRRRHGEVSIVEFELYTAQRER